MNALYEELDRQQKIIDNLLLAAKRVLRLLQYKTQTGYLPPGDTADNIKQLEMAIAKTGKGER